MNREIKFKAWHPELKQILYMNQQYGFKPVYTINSDCWTRFWESLNRCQEQLVLLQYTGLKDKHGREIYEGDVVSLFIETPSHENSRFEVKEVFWDENEFRFLLRVKSEITQTIEISELSINVEVIGNIFENPELLNNA